MEIVHRIPIDLEHCANLLERRAVSSTGIKPPPASRDFSRFHDTNLLDSAQSILKGDNTYHQPTAAPVGIMSLGRIWESVADVWLSDYARSQGGFFTPNVMSECDNIVASLDGLIYLPNVYPDQPMVAETKLRFTTSDEIPDRHERQIGCYCIMAGTCYAAYCRLQIGARPPIASAELIVLHFSHLWLNDVWKSVVATREFLESIGQVPKAIAKE